MDFEDMYYKHIDCIYSYINFKIMDKHLLEDIIQETFLAAYQSLDKLENISSIKAWLLSIAHNKMVDKLRKIKREIPIETDYNLEGIQYTQDNQHIFLKELFEKLDEISGQILYGVYVDGLSYNELSEILCIPEGTVKSKCYYAKKKLNRIFREREESNGSR